MSYIIWNNTTQKVHRGEQDAPYTVDGQPGALAEPLVELAVIRNEYPASLLANERAVSTRTIDLVAKTVTFGWSIEAYTPTAEELEEISERDLITMLIASCADMRNHVGTAAERITRIENFVGRLGPRLVKKGVLP
jgi:hypothetical protein